MYSEAHPRKPLSVVKEMKSNSTVLELADVLLAVLIKVIVFGRQNESFRHRRFTFGGHHKLLRMRIPRIQLVLLVVLLLARLHIV